MRVVLNSVKFSLPDSDKFLILSFLTVLQAGPKALLYMIIGGGVVAGAVGMIFGAEPVTMKTVLGMLMTVGGIILLTIG